MKTKIFLVRHGETEWNNLGKVQGSQNTKLSNEGIMQAQLLSEKFNNEFDFIYTSPLKRAIKTADIISQNSICKPTIVNDLREIDFGEWESLTFKEIECKFHDEFQKWKSDKFEAPLCGGDLSMKNASIRSGNAIKSIATSHPKKNIIIVAHGGIIIAGMVSLFNWDMTMYHKISIENASICELHFNDDLEPRIIKLNDTSHLQVSC